MSPLDAARAQMELSLGFHMIFAAVGMAMPVMMLIAERRWMTRGDEDAFGLAKKWSTVTAVLFAIGAVSGTALSFELGLLWPRFMAVAGPLIGVAFALEGYAFFIEAIFLGLYLYGWQRLSPRAHWWCGVVVALSGVASGVLVLSANAWMQHPVGFELAADGSMTNVDPWRAFLNPAWPLMAAHSTLSTYQAVGFAAAGVYATALWRNRRPDRARSYRLALRIALGPAIVAAVAQPLTGDFLARRAHERQPAKLAALEGQFHTERGAPLRIGGLPNEQLAETPWAIELPRMLSVLATHDPDAVIVGLEAFPREDWPPVALTHVAFQLMVGSGFLMLAVSAWYVWERWRYRRADDPQLSRLLLAALIVCTPLGFLALEAGWVVTEAGRQPWVVYGVMRTADAVTPRTDIAGSLAIFTGLYVGLLATLVVLLRRIARDDGPR